MGNVHLNGTFHINQYPITYLPLVQNFFYLSSAVTEAIYPPSIIAF